MYRWVVGLIAIAVAWGATVQHCTARTRSETPKAASGEVDASVMDGIVRELLAKARDHGSGPLRTVAFDGVAWQTGAGISAGTSRLGLSMNHQLRTALARRSVTVVRPADGSKGIGGKLLRAAFGVAKAGIALSVSLIDARTGRVLSEARRVMRSKLLGGLAGADLLPPESETAASLARLVRQSLGSQPSAFQLTVTTDRGANAAYYVGEPLHATVQSDRDCYLRLYHISWTDKALTLIYPNRHESNGFVPGGTPVRLPGAAAGVTFEVAPPCGVDALVAVASTQPFGDESWVDSQFQEGRGPAGPRRDTKAESAEDEDEEEEEDSDDESAFITVRGIDEERASGLIARGLIVRPTGSETTSPPDASDGDTELEADPDTSSPGTSTPTIARAVCFFTTLSER